MNTNTAPTTEERQRMWNEMEAQDAAGITPQRAAPANEQQASPQAASTVAETVETQAEAAPVERFAGVSQEVRDYILGMQTQVEQLSARVRGTEGHIGGIKSAMKAQREAAQATREAGGAAPTDAQIQAATAGGSGALERLKADYPEFGGHLAAVLAEELQALRTPKQIPAEVEQPQAQQTQVDVETIRRDAFIDASGFSGWKEKIAQPDFIGWYQRQPAEVQMLGRSSDPAHAVRLLTLHRDQTAAPAGGNKLDAFAGAANLNSSRAGGFQGTKSVDQMTPTEYWKHLEEQDRQQTQRG